MAALGAATGLVYALKPIAPVLSLGVLYTPAVLVAAVLFGAVYAIAVAVAAMLAFNFLFLPPVHTLTLADARNWTALAVYLITAVVSQQPRDERAPARGRSGAARARGGAARGRVGGRAARGAARRDPRARGAVLAGGGELAHARFEAGVRLAARAGARSVDTPRQCGAPTR